MVVSKAECQKKKIKKPQKVKENGEQLKLHETPKKIDMNVSA